jgi:Putative methyltransferase
LITDPPYDGTMPPTGSPEGETGDTGDGEGAAHWVRWHRAYEDPESPLSERLRLVQAALRSALDRQPPGPVRVISMCAGQGRDVIDVVATHERANDVQALLVELDPALAAFARDRAAAAGVAERIRVVQGDAALTSLYAEAVPADLVLVCGIFGNISDGDIEGIVAALPSFCAPGASVIWTRHRRPPDLTPTIREWFARAGFEEVSFDAPDPYVLAVGCHRLVAAPAAFDPGFRLFEFIGDGERPA